jgi:MoaA/NifB/PqqE/SkfB family radical SAM enzyme
MNPYRQDKVLQHLDRVRALCRGEHPAPVHVQIIISDLCNQNCLGFCSYRTEGYSSNELFFTRDAEGEILSRNPTRFIPLEKVREILEDCAAMGVKAIEITGGGEPTVHPNHATIFQTVRDLGMDLGLVTNGVALDERALAPLAASGGETWVRVSIDAGTPETYTKIRSCPPRHWDLAWRTVRRLAVAKATTPRSPLVVGVSFVLTKENWREVVMATQLAIAAGADNIRIGGLFQNSRTHYYDTFLDEARVLCAEAVSLATPDFTVVNLFGDRYQDLVQGPPDYRTCGYQRLSTYIGGDLNLYRCCVQSYNRRGLIGSLKDQRFADVWWGIVNNPEYLQFDARGCAMCQHNTKNRTIQEAIDAHRHGSFV